MTIKMRIDGSAISSQAVGHRDLGYGQDPGRPTSTLEILVSRTFLLTLLGAPYEAFVSETRDMWPDDRDAEDLLQVAGYPPLTAVMDSEALLSYVLTEWLHFD